VCSQLGLLCVGVCMGVGVRGAWGVVLERLSGYGCRTVAYDGGSFTMW
jgi:hypothetical protein